MKKSVIGALLVSFFVMGCSDDASKVSNSFETLKAGDINNLLEFDPSADIEKFRVVTSEVMIPKANDGGFFTRKISFMDGFKQIAEVDEWAYSGSDPKERDVVSKTILDDFSKGNGKLVGPPEVSYLPAKSSSTSAIKQETYTFSTLKHGYTVALTFHTWQGQGTFSLLTFKSYTK